MFKPTSAKDRINYGEVLMPPVGFRLERAVGTTYSLDLETLTAVSIALGLIEDTDSELISNPISMLSALQKISDRIIVFCEAGQIKLPRSIFFDNDRSKPSNWIACGIRQRSLCILATSCILDRY